MPGVLDVLVFGGEEAPTDKSGRRSEGDVLADQNNRGPHCRFWGPQTSPINWCEEVCFLHRDPCRMLPCIQLNCSRREDYSTSSYIAEFWNTVNPRPWNTQHNRPGPVHMVTLADMITIGSCWHQDLFRMTQLVFKLGFTQLLPGLKRPLHHRWLLCPVVLGTGTGKRTRTRSGSG